MVGDLAPPKVTKLSTLEEQQSITLLPGGKSSASGLYNLFTERAHKKIKLSYDVNSLLDTRAE